MPARSTTVRRIAWCPRWIPSKFPTVTTGRSSLPAASALPCKTFKTVPSLALRRAHPVALLRRELSHLLRRDRYRRHPRDRDRRDDGELRSRDRLRRGDRGRGVVSLSAPPILLPALPAPRGLLRRRVPEPGHARALARDPRREDERHRARADRRADPGCGHRVRGPRARAPRDRRAEGDEPL